MKFLPHVIVNRSGTMGSIGPFHSEEDRAAFCCALWFHLPAREPGALRGARIPFDASTDQMYLTDVRMPDGAICQIRPVTVGDIAKARNFPRDRKRVSE